MNPKFFDSTLIKFLLVGVLNTFIGAGIMFLLYNIANCTYWFSSAANYLVGGLISFFLNNYFTFKNIDWSWKHMGKFMINVVVSYIVAYGIAKPVVCLIVAEGSRQLQENIAMFVGMCLYTGLNYCGQRFFVFRKIKRI